LINSPLNSIRELRHLQLVFKDPIPGPMRRQLNKLLPFQ
jgi:hypothetical protein